jgi:hypothetical protein
MTEVVCAHTVNETLVAQCAVVLLSRSGSVSSVALHSYAQVFHSVLTAAQLVTSMLCCVHIHTGIEQ